MGKGTDISVLIGMLIITVLGLILSFTVTDERILNLAPDIFGAGLGGSAAALIILLKNIFK